MDRNTEVTGIRTLDASDIDQVSGAGFFSDLWNRLLGKKVQVSTIVFVCGQQPPSRSGGTGIAIGAGPGTTTKLN